MRGSRGVQIAEDKTGCQHRRRLDAERKKENLHSSGEQSGANRKASATANMS